METLSVNSGSGNIASEASNKSGPTETHDGDAEGCGYMEGSGEGWDDGEIDRKVGRTENFAGIYHPVYILWRINLRHCLLQTKGKVTYLDELLFPGYCRDILFCDSSQIFSSGFFPPRVCLTEKVRSIGWL